MGMICKSMPMCSNKYVTRLEGRLQIMLELCTINIETGDISSKVATSFNR
jgi:hypothetical protein